MSEEITKSLVQKRIIQLGYPCNHATKENGIVWYRESSYKNYDSYLTDAFSKSSKSLTKMEGRPDFTITCDTKKIIIVIECKEDILKHQTVDNLEEYQHGIGTIDEIRNYCINGALHYAQFINNNDDVIAVAVSGTDELNMRITSFLLPKGKNLKDIKLIEDSDYQNAIMNFDDYERTINKVLDRYQEESKKIFKELSSYAIACSNFLRANGISAKDRAGFISALVLALTDEDTILYTLVKTSLPDGKNKVFKDLIYKNVIKELKTALEDIWDNKDKIPKIKKDSLKEYYNKILTKSLLNRPEGKNKYFQYGENVLSCCLFSIYQNIVILLKPYKDLDIMGTFYTVFLKYASGDAKDKGIVLTPKHITEIFCDIAEYYLGQKMDETTKVLDICCGTGGFLIAALNKMDNNIDSLTISRNEKKYRKELVRRHCLIGVESEPEMFALAYANMRFHGDGKSNLYSCSSLLKDKDTNKGIAGKDEIKGKHISLIDELKTEKYYDDIKNETIERDRSIDIGMINPPYSLTASKNKDKKNENQKGQSELDFVYSMLTYLRKRGIGIAIVPVSCASNKGKKLRETILKEHTLLACMSMPKQLFKNSKVGTTTCIMVFRAHVPHNDSSKIVFLSRWLDDGFVNIPHQGRIEKDGSWLSHKSEWMRQLKGSAKFNDTVFIRKEINIKDECLAEAYIETDYSKLTEKDFEKQLKKYALYIYMEENGLLDV